MEIPSSLTFTLFLIHPFTMLTIATLSFALAGASVARPVASGTPVHTIQLHRRGNSGINVDGTVDIGAIYQQIDFMSQ